MIIGIIIIILCFLIPGYCIYRYGGNEGTAIQVAINNGGEQPAGEDDNSRLNINNENINNENFHPDPNINFILFDNNNGGLDPNNNINLLDNNNEEEFHPDDNNNINRFDVNNDDNNNMNNMSNDTINTSLVNEFLSNENSNSNIDNSSNYIEHVNINNINNENKNIINNNEKKSFEEQVKEQIEKNIKDINWGDIPGEAQKIHNCLTKNAQKESNTLEEIKKILKAEKSKGEKEAVKNWLKENDVKNKNEDINTIIARFSSDKKANIYQNTYEEIIAILLLRKCLDDLSNVQFNQLKGIEMKLLEKKVEEKERKEKELEEKIKKYDEEAEDAKEILGKEPDEKDPNACNIIFHSPDRLKSWGRRFLKTDKISMLYNFVKSNGREIFTEPDSTDFDIFLIGFPRKNLGNYKNNSLADEGFFPNAELQIQEN